jgi:hypothetical protein
LCRLIKATFHAEGASNSGKQFGIDIATKLGTGCLRSAAEIKMKPVEIEPRIAYSKAGAPQ